LALFTNKLGIAILIAALIRVHDGWPAVVQGAGTSAERPSVWEAWYLVRQLAFYVAPLGLLAADFGRRIERRMHVTVAALMGVALPLFAALLLVGVIGKATLASRFSQGSLGPTVAMALWSKTAASAQPGRWLIAAITVFGAARFGIRALANAASIRIPGAQWRYGLLGCFILAASWASLHHFASAFTMTFDFSARCLGVLSAVITGDLLMRRRCAEKPPKIDWIGTIALLAGLATPLYITHGPMELTPNPWWYPWLLPSYAVGLAACICGRAAQMGIAKRIWEPNRPR